jgi:hypothetical protein
MDIRPEPRFIAMLYAAIEYDRAASWICDRATGRITKVREGGPSLMAVIARFADERPHDAAAIERDIPEDWPEDESSLGFVCPGPHQLIPALREG